MSTPRVLIAAGGTGGHVFPALAVAEALQSRGWHAEWVGTDRGLESRVVPARGIGLHILRFTGLRGKGLAAWLTLPSRLWRAFAQAREIVRAFRPNVVVAFGGYVTFPIGLAARGCRVPLCIHEQNAVMGTANRWLAKIADRVMVSFPGTAFAPADAELTGNPVREDIVAMAHPSARYAERVGPLRLAVIGGSLGASAINAVMPAAIGRAQSEGASLEIIHQTGERDLAAVTGEYAKRNITARCQAFIDDVGEVYAWADVVIARAGASTVSELACAGVAGIFIPLPNAIDDHQTANARYLTSAEAGWLMPQSGLDAEQLGHLLGGLTRDELLKRAVRARERGWPLATGQVASCVTSLGVPARGGQA